MRKILFIGNIQWGEAPTGGGVQAKNQQIIKYLLNRRDIELTFVDTWKKSAMKSVLTAIKEIVLSSRHTKIYFSITIRGVVAIIFLMTLLNIKRNMYLFVSGGSVDKSLTKTEKSVLSKLKRIYVQGKFLKMFYERNGLGNIEVLHNFKSLSYRPIQRRTEDDSIKCVFLGRVFTEKGIDTIIDAFSCLQEKNINIDIYGSLVNYSPEYFSKFSNIRYQGFLNLNDKKGYDILAQYDVMVFPTRFEGEGFPGVILDAFIAGLPVVTTDFHVNPEIIMSNKNGLIIPVSDSQALADALLKFYNDSSFLNKLRIGAYDSAEHYTPENLLDPIFE